MVKYHFLCGCIRTDFLKVKKYLCPDHKAELGMIEKLCKCGCGKTLWLDPKKSKTKRYLDECQKRKVRQYTRDHYSKKRREKHASAEGKKLKEVKPIPKYYPQDVINSVVDKWRFPEWTAQNLKD